MAGMSESSLLLSYNGRDMKIKMKEKTKNKFLGRHKKTKNKNFN